MWRWVVGHDIELKIHLDWITHQWSPQRNLFPQAQANQKISCIQWLLVGMWESAYWALYFDFITGFGFIACMLETAFTKWLCDRDGQRTSDRFYCLLLSWCACSAPFRPFLLQKHLSLYSMAPTASSRSSSASPYKQSHIQRGTELGPLLVLPIIHPLFLRPFPKQALRLIVTWYHRGARTRRSLTYPMITPMLLQPLQQRRNRVSDVFVLLWSVSTGSHLSAGWD